MPRIDELLAELRDRFAAEYQRGRADAFQEVLDAADRLEPIPTPSRPAPIEAVEEDRDPPEEIAPVDCATLDPITPIQFKCFSIIVEARGGYVSSSQFADRTNNAGAMTAVYALEKKGYVRRREIAKHKNAWDVACFGAPRQIATGEHPHSLANRPIDAPAPPSYRSPAPPVLPHEPKKNGASPPSVTSELMGDPIHECEDINAKTYLIRKGHTCAVAINGLRVDGRVLGKPEILALVNTHRAKADLPALENIGWE